MPVRPRGSGWQADKRYRGERIRVKCASEGDAQAWEAAARAAIRQGNRPIPPGQRAAGQPSGLGRGRSASRSRPTLGVLLAEVIASDWGRRPSGRVLILNARAAIRHFGTRQDVRELREVDVARYIRALRAQGDAGATINRKLAALSRLFRQAREIDPSIWTPALPRQPEDGYHGRRYSPVEERRIYRALEHMGLAAERDLFVFLFDTGCLVAEALALRWEDLRIGVGTPIGEGRLHWSFQPYRPDPSVPTIFGVEVAAQAHLGAAQTIRRVVPLGETGARAVAQRWHAEAETGSRCGPFGGLGRPWIDELWRSLRDGLKLGTLATLAAIRDTKLCRMAEAGADIAQLQAWAGHKSRSTTMRYCTVPRVPLSDVAGGPTD